MSPTTASTESLDEALAHIERWGDTDIFPVPFEYQAIRYSWTDADVDGDKKFPGLRTWLASQDLDTWPSGSYRRCLTPKGHLGFRISTQLDPLDALILTAIVFEIGDALEDYRVPASDRVVHSYRLRRDGDGQLYDPDFGYRSFQSSARELLDRSDVNCVVVTDIADFFPRLYSHPLENALVDSGASADLVRCLMKLLSKWNIRVSYGVPVGPAAARLLAEVAISDIDFSLIHDGYRYCRFTDDFRIFCSDEHEAHQALAHLAQVLYANHGLTLQPQKTAIGSPRSSELDICGRPPMRKNCR